MPPQQFATRRALMLRRISALVVVLLATSYAIAATPSAGKAAAHNEIKNDNPAVLGGDPLGQSVQSKALVAGFVSFQGSPTLPSCSKPGPLEPCCPPQFSKQRFVLPGPAVDPVPVRYREKTEVSKQPVCYVVRSCASLALTGLALYGY